MREGVGQGAQAAARPPQMDGFSPTVTLVPGGYEEALDRYDRQLITAALSQCKGRIRETARLLWLVYAGLTAVLGDALEQEQVVLLVLVLSAVLYAIASHPDQWQRLRADPQLARGRYRVPGLGVRAGTSLALPFRPAPVPAGSGPGGAPRRRGR